MTKEDFIKSLSHGKNSNRVSVFVVVCKNIEGYTATMYYSVCNRTIKSDTISYNSASLEDIDEILSKFLVRDISPHQVFLSSDLEVVEVWS